MHIRWLSLTKNRDEYFYNPNINAYTMVVAYKQS